MLFEEHIYFMLVAGHTTIRVMDSDHGMFEGILALIAFNGESPYGNG